MNYINFLDWTIFGRTRPILATKFGRLQVICVNHFLTKPKFSLQDYFVGSYVSTCSSKYEAVKVNGFAVYFSQMATTSKFKTTMCGKSLVIIPMTFEPVRFCCLHYLVLQGWKVKNISKISSELCDRNATTNDLKQKKAYWGILWISNDKQDSFAQVVTFCHMISNKNGNLISIFCKLSHLWRQT